MLKGKVTMMPGCKEMARVLESLDLSIQAEQVIMELQEVFIWTTFNEWGLQICLFLLFCIQPG